MLRRAAICIGVDRAGSMTPLRAAASGAIAFEAWATSQGCDTKLLVDNNDGRISVNDIFDTVNSYVDQAVYDQLIIYFSGHGILTAPGTEYWLLSRAPQNPNEAINVSRSVQDARNSGIPHVIFISDACRSSVQGPPLSGMLGGAIFPNRPFGPYSAEVDIFYATSPGDPAWEVPEPEATQEFRGIFTDCLLKEVSDPTSPSWEVDRNPPLHRVITSRSLREHLVSRVEEAAEAVNIQLHQQPRIIVETALPLYFALGNRVAAFIIPPKPIEATRTIPTTNVEKALDAINPTRIREISRGISSTDSPLGLELARKIGFSQQVEKLLNSTGRKSFETRTGFTIYGTSLIDVIVDKKVWNYDPSFQDLENDQAYHVRLWRVDKNDSKNNSIYDTEDYSLLDRSGSILFQFNDETGTVLAILPGFIGTIMVEDGRVISVNYVPAMYTRRYEDYLQNIDEVEKMKAFAAVASRNGNFTIDTDNAYELARRIRQLKGIDPIMGLYATYSYAQIGKYEEVYSVFRFMYNDDYIPLLFDVVMLARKSLRYHQWHKMYKGTEKHFAPSMPMLSQGWALLNSGDPMHNPVHELLRPHLIPSLWTTFTQEGVSIASNALFNL